jgi:hypothetical protein
MALAGRWNKVTGVSSLASGVVPAGLRSRGDLDRRSVLSVIVVDSAAESTTCMAALVSRVLGGSRASYRHLGMVLLWHVELLSDEWGLLRTGKSKRVGEDASL